MEEKTPKKSRGKGTSARESFSTPTLKDTPVKCPTCRTENPSDSRFCSSCASPLKESAARTVKSPTFEISRGDLFAGRYEIIETLGQGGMGKVFKAYDRKISDVLAVKLIRPEISVNDKAIERFKNELKIARKITHRNICRMHDLGEEGYFHFITMEYVAGEDLKRFIRRAGTLSSGKAVNIAKQVCEGLAEAHRLGVIHRDLKPQNIMIDQDGNAKIMDFGIARFVDTDRMTGSGVMIGTPEYMSPEQVELKDVDKRADIYALGIVLYEMVTGRVPFEGETPLSIAMKHKTEKAKNVRELNPQVSAGLAGIISKCMEKDPGNRYQSAEELLEALNKAEQELATGERIVPKKEPISTKEITVTFQVKKLVVPAAAVILLVIIALAVWKFLPRKDSAVPPVQTNEAAVQKPDPAKQQSDSATQKTDAATVTPKTAQSTDKTVPKKESVPPSAPAQKQPEIKEAKTRDAGTGSAAEAKKDEAKAPPEQSKAGAQDSDMNSASLAMARVTGARSQALKGGLSVKDLFFRLAEAKAQEGQKFLTQKSPVEARSLLVVAERLFRISLDKNKDEDRLNILKNFVENLREDVEDKKIVSPGNKLYDSAKESEKQAAAFLAKKDIENSAKAYIQASAIYEKFLLSYQPPKNK